MGEIKDFTLDTNIIKLLEEYFSRDGKDEGLRELDTEEFPKL
jgi:hypothetical protein